MQLPDEAITYDYQSLLLPPNEEWTPTAELRCQHFLAPAKIKGLAALTMQIRSQTATERDMQQFPPEQQPVHAGFIDRSTKRLMDSFALGDSGRPSKYARSASRTWTWKGNAGLPRVLSYRCENGFVSPRAYACSACRTRSQSIGRGGFDA